jgi:hypothetical protein
MNQENLENEEAMKNIEKMATERTEHTVLAPIPAIIKIIEPSDILETAKHLGIDSSLVASAIFLDSNMEELLEIIDRKIENILTEFVTEKLIRQDFGEDKK